MTAAHRRKKDPESVRRRLLDCAVALGLEHGPGGITVEAVSKAAGVTKGGLFHHFPSKQALVEAVFRDYIGALDRAIDTAMEADPNPRGRFTRAYVLAVFDEPVMESGSRWAALHISALSEPSVRLMWSNWFAQRAERHRDTDSAPTLEIVRLAADGTWLASCLDTNTAAERDLAGLRQRLITLTQD